MSSKTQSSVSPPSATLTVRVQPRASRDEITGYEEGVLRVRLTAPPVEGAANAACRDFLAKSLGVPRRQIQLVSGEKARVKRFSITGLTPAGLKAKITRLLAG